MAKQRNEQVTNIDARKQLKRCQFCLLSHWLTVDARITELHPVSSLPPLPFLFLFSQPTLKLSLYTTLYCTNVPKARPKVLQLPVQYNSLVRKSFIRGSLLTNNICKQRLDIYEAVEFNFIMKSCNLYSVLYCATLIK